MVYRTARFSMILNKPKPTFQCQVILWRWISPTCRRLTTARPANDCEHEYKCVHWNLWFRPNLILGKFHLYDRFSKLLSAPNFLGQTMYVTPPPV